MISFNEPILVEKGIENILDSIKNKKRINGDGDYTRQCTDWFEERYKTNCLLTTSCTHALEMAAILAEIKEGDEIIMPSYTFVSTADAFVLRGAKIKFVDIRKDTMNIDEALIEDAITERTRAIVPVHYAGVGCEMDIICEIAKKHNLIVIEDAAQAMEATYKGKQLGTFGDFGAFSFHETKNFTMGEGGLCLLNREDSVERAEIIREKGTNRRQFFRGEIDKYSWVDLGSSYLPSELNAAYLAAQLEMVDDINEKRMDIWKTYYAGLEELASKEYIELPYIPKECKHNAHMFYIKLKNLEERTKFISYMKMVGVGAVFHYVPLHSSIAGKKFGEFVGSSINTERESERLVRLPMFYNLDTKSVDYVIEQVNNYFKG